MQKSHSKPTPQRNLGARDERRAVLTRISAMKRTASTARSTDIASGYVAALDELRSWIVNRSKRTGKAPGGVGRR